MSIESIIADLDAQLEALNAEHEGLDLRGKVLRLVNILKTTRRLNIEVLRTQGITARRGPNTRRNLIVVCNRCHDDIHAGRVEPPTPE